MGDGKMIEYIQSVHSDLALSLQYDWIEYDFILVLALQVFYYLYDKIHTLLVHFFIFLSLINPF